MWASGVGNPGSCSPGRDHGVHLLMEPEVEAFFAGREERTEGEHAQLHRKLRDLSVSWVWFPKAGISSTRSPRSYGGGMTLCVSTTVCSSVDMLLWGASHTQGAESLM